MSTDPTVQWWQVRILEHLKQRAIPLHLLHEQLDAELAPTMAVVLDLANQGYVFIDNRRGTKILAITPHGHAYLFDILARSSCA